MALGVNQEANNVTSMEYQNIILVVTMNLNLSMYISRLYAIEMFGALHSLLS